jgi:HIV Tat-specific factor 1
MNGRYFAGRKLVAEFYDGWTNYEVKETDEQSKERIETFHDWLENQ